MWLSQRPIPPEATERAEDEACERGTEGCSVAHSADTTTEWECATW